MPRQGAAGVATGSDGSRNAVRFKPQTYFTLRIEDDEISGDRFPNQLDCSSISNSDQVSCNGIGVMLTYVSTSGEYILTQFGKGPVALEVGNCSWLAN